MSEKNYDDHNRLRSKTIAFRVSPEEDKQINTVVSLSGLTKQEFIMSKLMDRTISVIGNCKIHRAVYDRLTDVLTELQRLEAGAEISDELADDISLIVELIDTLYMKNNVATA